MYAIRSYYASFILDFPIDGNRHIRTDLRTKRTGNASLQIFLGNNRREKPLAVDFIAHFDQAVGAGRITSYNVCYTKLLRVAAR